MNDEQINRRIAEACGWKDVHHSWDWGNVWIGTKVEPHPTAPYEKIPNYAGDLNAMHIAQLTLKRHSSRSMFRKFLHDEVMEDPMNPDNAPEFATARQRAEAFLRTIGKWEDEYDASKHESYYP